MMPGFRIDFDARDARVYFLFGYQVIDSMSIGLFKTLFGVEEVRRLLHGDTYTRGASLRHGVSTPWVTTASDARLRDGN